MASPPGQALLSRSCSEDSCMCYCDASLLDSGFGPAGGCSSNPFADFRQLFRWVPVCALPLSGDADKDAPGLLWNTDRDTSIADALLERLLTGETGAGGRSGFMRQPLRMTGLAGPHLDPFPEPSLSPLDLSDGAAAVSRVTADGAAARISSRQTVEVPSAAPAPRLTPSISAFVMQGQAAHGASGRSKTLPHGLERSLLAGKTMRRTSAPGFANSPLRISELAQQASVEGPFAAWARTKPSWSDATVLERAIMPTPSRELSMSERSSMDYLGTVFNPFEEIREDAPVTGEMSADYGTA